MHFFPLAFPFLLAFFLLLVFWIASVEIGVLGYAYEKMGIPPRYVYGLLLLSLLGSYVNIPVGELPNEQILPGQVVPFFGMRHVVPMIAGATRTIIAVNLGGAVVPTLLSLYLFTKHGFWLRGCVGIALVAVVTHSLASPVPGVGIALPLFVPPLTAAATALVLARRSAPALAYVSGSLGTLIGADLTNLDKVAGLGAPVASIGGAGTFDGIFLTGVIAVLLA